MSGSGCCLLMLLLLHFVFLFQISGDVGEQFIFYFCAEGFILPRTSPTVGHSLPVGSHLVVIQ